MCLVVVQVNKMSCALEMAAVLINKIVDQRKVQLRLREDLRGGRVLLTVSINRCFDKFLILAKRGTLFRALKPGPAVLINEIVD